MFVCMYVHVCVRLCVCMHVCTCMYIAYTVFLCGMYLCTLCVCVCGLHNSPQTQDVLFSFGTITDVYDNTANVNDTVSVQVTAFVPAACSVSSTMVCS